MEIGIADWVTTSGGHCWTAAELEDVPSSVLAAVGDLVLEWLVVHHVRSRLKAFQQCLRISFGELEQLLT